MVDLEFAHIHNPPIGSMRLTLLPALRDTGALGNRSTLLAA